MSVCCAVPSIRLTAPAVAAPAVVGRHRREASTGARIGRVLDAVARMGSVVTLVAILVVAGAAAGLADDTPADDIPTVTVTFDHAGR